MCSTIFCHLLRKLHNFIFPKLFFFWAKNCSRCVLQLSREWKFLSLREFYKDQNKWKFEFPISDVYGRWITTSHWSYNDFCLVIKNTHTHTHTHTQTHTHKQKNKRSLVLSWWKIMHFLLTNSGCFWPSTAFSWSNWE